jgi:hypothetical protein
VDRLDDVIADNTSFNWVDAETRKRFDMIYRLICQLSPNHAFAVCDQMGTEWTRKWNICETLSESLLTRRTLKETLYVFENFLTNPLKININMKKQLEMLTKKRLPINYWELKDQEDEEIQINQKGYIYFTPMSRILFFLMNRYVDKTLNFCECEKAWREFYKHAGSFPNLTNLWQKYYPEEKYRMPPEDDIVILKQEKKESNKEKELSVKTIVVNLRMDNREYPK